MTPPTPHDIEARRCASAVALAERALADAEAAEDEARGDVASGDDALYQARRHLTDCARDTETARRRLDAARDEEARVVEAERIAEDRAVDRHDDRDAGRL